MVNRINEILIGIVLLVMMMKIQESSAKCCRNGVHIAYIEKQESEKAIVTADICYDGIRKEDHCGRGHCNWFGCECEIGCKINNCGKSMPEAIRLFEEMNDVEVTWSEAYDYNINPYFIFCYPSCRRD